MDQQGSKPAEAGDASPDAPSSDPSRVSGPSRDATGLSRAQLRLEYAKMREDAQQHGRHLDSLTMSTMGLVIVLATGGTVVISQTRESNIHPLDATTIFLLLFCAFAICILALANRSLLVPNPEAAGSPDGISGPGGRLGVERYCMENAAGENKNRKHSLVSAWLLTLLSAGNFAMWIFPDADPNAQEQLWDSNTAAQTMLAGLGVAWTIGFWVRRICSRSHRTQADYLREHLVIDLEGSKFRPKDKD